MVFYTIFFHLLPSCLCASFLQLRNYSHLILLQFRNSSTVTSFTVKLLLWYACYPEDSFGSLGKYLSELKVSNFHPYKSHSWWRSLQKCSRSKHARVPRDRDQGFCIMKATHRERWKHSFSFLFRWRHDPSILFSGQLILNGDLTLRGNMYFIIRCY